MKLQMFLYGVALGAFTLSTPAAKAQPVTLACGPTPSNRVGGGFVHFDESKGRAGTGSAEKPEPYGGDNPATFSTTEVKWEYRDERPYSRMVNSYVLSRTTGELDSTWVVPGDRLSPHHDVSYCYPVKPEF